MNERKSKNIVIIALCITLIFMGVGFSALSQTLTINGTTTVSGRWDVRITDIKATSAFIAGAAAEDLTAYNAELAEGSTANGVRFDATSATFNLNLAEPGDWVEYTVTVTNGGNIDATLNSIVTSLDEVTAEDEAKEPIKYTLTRAEGDLLATAGQNTDTYIVRATYDPSFTGANVPAADKMSRAYTVTMIYNQKN